MWRYILIFLTALVVNFFYFPASSPYLPSNTKNLLALMGGLLLAYDLIRYRSYDLNKYLFGALGIAALYSVVNLVAVEINDEFDFSYANYVTTALIWLSSAYAATWAIRYTHGRVTIKLLTYYLAAVCVAQGVIAIAIDNIPSFKILVDSIFEGGEYMEEFDRLYGIGCGLDVGGLRMAVTQVFIAFVLCVDDEVKRNSRALYGLLISLILIAVIGNMIARTTSVGTLLALVTIIMSTQVYTLRITGKNIKMYTSFGWILLMTIPIAVYLYNTDPFFYQQFRFAFEAFFNYFEQGSLRTDSTDVLQTMWKWPETLQGWIIGTGLFGRFLYGTDIGYCRFILYSGLVGFSVFAFFFLYHGYVFISRYRRYRYLFVALLMIHFAVWAKVSTDTFFIWALLYTFVDEDEADYLPKLSL